MSNYGPPGGPNPGQPPQWPAGQPDEPRYGQPSDPWGGPDAQVSTPPVATGSPAGDPGYHDYREPTQPVGGTQRFDQQPYPPPPQFGPQGQPQPVWTQAAPVPPARKSKGPLIALVAVLAVLVLGGGGVAAWTLLGGDEKKPDVVGTGATTQPEGGSGADPTGAPTSPSAEPEPAPSSAAPGSDNPLDQVQNGQCVKNEGTNEKPTLVIVECGEGTYTVLSRINGKTNGSADAKAKCGREVGVGKYSDWYYFDSELDELDFVLCLQKR
ncbi:flagellar basal body protein FliL [Polymorphospora sp. NPDC051019]|uniref:LppU/SCO3897 family protein n=1 Tax=Polymorphospora sp. NPDC051019 TaxID=3155725 RepID=UPI003449E7C5